MPLRVFLCAGEASGDLHAGSLAAALRRLEPSVEIEGVGGPAMRDAGVRLLHTNEEFAVLGISEVVSRLPFFLRVLKEFEARFRSPGYDLVIPVDFPDFNIRLAARAKRAGIPVLWYISPQVWAWGKGRIATLAKVVDRMIVVFPFETELYEKAGVPVEFVGHPLLEIVRPVGRPRNAVRSELGLSPGAGLLALLPGSRVQEVHRILPHLARAAKLLSADGVRCVVSRAPSVPEKIVDAVLKETGADLPVWSGSTYDLVAAADLAVVASGTATLETGLLGTPPIVVYRMAALSWIVAKNLVKMPYIGLVNIAAGRKIAPELLQDEVTGENVAREVRTLLADPERLAGMRKALEGLAGRLGGPGASERTARAALDLARGGR